MKLYATTTSERASKGQGGNKFLETIITIDKQEILKIVVQEYNKDTNTYHLSIRKEGQKSFLWAGYIKPKAEKKKAECPNRHDCLLDDLGNCQLMH